MERKTEFSLLRTYLEERQRKIRIASEMHIRRRRKRQHPAVPQHASQKLRSVRASERPNLDFETERGGAYMWQRRATVYKPCYVAGMKIASGVCK